jgi:3-oxoacyl-[acyl-carrier-protein] synthase II
VIARGTAAAVTGLGAVAANGHSVEEIWASCLAGRSGIARLPAAGSSTTAELHLAGAITGFDFGSFVSRRDLRNYDLSQLYAAAAARMALEDAGGPELYERERIGVVIGTGAGAVRTHVDTVRASERAGSGAVSAYYPAVGSASLSASLPAMRLGLRGPVYGVTGACATGAYDLVSATHLLAAGDADLVLAGAVDTLAVEVVLSGFANMRALARHVDPARACRPLDLERNGLVLAEGAAVIALERLDAARARGARVYGVLAGYGLTSDAGDVLAADAAGIERACLRAIERAGLAPRDVDHVNLHASGTRQGDLVEARALHRVLGDRAAAVPVTAPKSLFGHAMGAAAALEAVVLLKTLETGLIPPTINLETPDPAIALNAAARTVEASIRVALSTNSGLGGLNAALVFRAG